MKASGNAVARSMTTIILLMVTGCMNEEPGIEPASLEGTQDALSVDSHAGSDPAMELVPASESAELRHAGAMITPLRGTAPLLVRDSLKLGSPEGETEAQATAGLEPMDVSPNLFDSGEFRYNGGTWGTSFDTVVSQRCNGRRRDYATAYAYDNNGGYCSFVRWYTDDLSDCRFIVHVGASSWKRGTCAWAVYANETGSYSYTASNTNSAQQNTVNARIYLQPGQTLTAGTCGLAGASASGDTYLRLYNSSGVQVASNDDACSSLSSSLTYTSTESSGNIFELRAGCWSSASCGGTVVWSKYP